MAGACDFSRLDQPGHPRDRKLLVRAAFVDYFIQDMRVLRRTVGACSFHRLDLPGHTRVLRGPWLARAALVDMFLLGIPTFAQCISIDVVV